MVKNGVVYPRFGADRPLEFAKLTKNFGYECIERMSKVLETHGDYDCLINGYFYLYGKTTSCGEKTKTLSGLIKDSRLLGKITDTKYIFNIYVGVPVLKLRVFYVMIRKI